MEMVIVSLCISSSMFAVVWTRLCSASSALQPIWGAIIALLLRRSLAKFSSKIVVSLYNWCIATTIMLRRRSLYHLLQW